MRKTIVLAALLSPVMLGGQQAAEAADNGFYLGAGVGQSDIAIEAGLGLDVDGDDTGYKVIAGFRPLDFLAFELNYVDFGKVTESGSTVEADAIAAYALALLPLGPVDFFAKAGVSDSDASLENTLGRTSASGTDFAYGGGLQIRFWSLAARLEYEIYDLDDVKDLNMLTLAVTYTFL